MSCADAAGRGRAMSVQALTWGVIACGDLSGSLVAKWEKLSSGREFRETGKACTETCRQAETAMRLEGEPGRDDSANPVAPSSYGRTFGAASSAMVVTTRNARCPSSASSSTKRRCSCSRRAASTSSRRYRVRRARNRQEDESRRGPSPSTEECQRVTAADGRARFDAASMSRSSPSS